jgi:CxxC motif-containing protein
MNMICICCPKGCHLEVDVDNNYEVSGNSCPRGKEYGKAEAISPVRTVTSSVYIQGSTTDKCPVKTDQPIPKAMMFDVMNEILDAKITAPAYIGDVIIEKVCGTDANIVVTKNCPRRH